MTIRVLPTAVSLLLLVSVTAFAQVESVASRPGLMKIYEDWKQKEYGDKAEVPDHIALVVISQRIDGASAQLDIAAFGRKGNELTLEIQPLISIRNAEGQITGSEAVGKPNKIVIGKPGRTVAPEDGVNNDSGSPTTVSVLIPADPRADAVLVKWVLSKRDSADGGDRKQALSVNELHVLLGESPNSALMAVTKGKGTER